jgi:hypothetical protein
MLPCVHPLPGRQQSPRDPDLDRAMMESMGFSMVSREERDEAALALTEAERLMQLDWLRQHGDAEPHAAVHGTTQEQMRSMIASASRGDAPQQCSAAAQTDVAAHWDTGP